MIGMVEAGRSGRGRGPCLVVGWSKRGIRWINIFLRDQRRSQRVFVIQSVIQRQIGLARLGWVDYN